MNMFKRRITLIILVSMLCNISTNCFAGLTHLDYDNIEKYIKFMAQIRIAKPKMEGEWTKYIEKSQSLARDYPHGKPTGIKGFFYGSGYDDRRKEMDGILTRWLEHKGAYEGADIGVQGLEARVPLLKNIPVELRKIIDFEIYKRIEADKRGESLGPFQLSDTERRLIELESKLTDLGSIITRLQSEID